MSTKNIQACACLNKYKHLSIRQTCELTGLSRSYISEQIRLGKLKSRKFGQRRLIPAAALDAFLQGGDL